MDICHLKNAELEAKHQKYKGRVVLRGDIVKDDSGSFAVFTEQGSSASQMTAPKVMDIISRLPGCAGEICTVILWQDCYGKGNLRKSYCSTVGRRFPIGNAYSCTVKKGYSYLCMWTTSHWLDFCCRFGKPTSFLDHVYLGSSQRQCEISKDSVDNYRAMFESRISAG